MSAQLGERRGERVLPACRHVAHKQPLLPPPSRLHSPPPQAARPEHRGSVHHPRLWRRPNCAATSGHVGPCALRADGVPQEQPHQMPCAASLLCPRQHCCMRCDRLAGQHVLHGRCDRYQRHHPGVQQRPRRPVHSAHSVSGCLGRLWGPAVRGGVRVGVPMSTDGCASLTPAPRSLPQTGCGGARARHLHP